MCESVCAQKRPNKAEIDAVLGGESFLMVADIQPQKILHWMWKRSKPRTSNWEPEKKKEEQMKERKRKLSTGEVDHPSDLIKLKGAICSSRRRNSRFRQI